MTGRMVWGVRGVFTLGIVASLAANVLHARQNPISQVIAAWPPVALLLTVELISRIPVGRRSLAAVRLTATATLAGIAGWVSYWHMVEVIRRYGEDTTTAHLMPLSVDGLMIVASVCLVEIGAAARKPSPVSEDIPDVAPAAVGSHHSAAALSPSEQTTGTTPDCHTPVPDQDTAPPRKASLPRGYVKTAARDVIRTRPAATVPELVAAVVDRTGTHRKHATKTIRDVLQEGIPA